MSKKRAGSTGASRKEKAIARRLASGEPGSCGKVVFCKEMSCMIKGCALMCDPMTCGGMTFPKTVSLTSK